MQSLLKLIFFLGYPACQNSIDFQMQSPKLVDGHQFKIVAFDLHIANPWQRYRAASSTQSRNELHHQRWKPKLLDSGDGRTDDGDTKRNCEQCKDEARSHPMLSYSIVALQSIWVFSQRIQ
jgi:hypothetical protein